MTELTREGVVMNEPGKSVVLITLENTVTHEFDESTTPIEVIEFIYKHMDKITSLYVGESDGYVGTIYGNVTGDCWVGNAIRNGEMLDIYEDDLISVLTKYGECEYVHVYRSKNH